ncbi:MAG: hypothetical protein ACE5GX_17255 [Thermoanaerobaculia bacterium]
MNRKLKSATQGWLKLERDGRNSAAERALGRVFSALPTPAPSRALVGRTLAELGFDPSLAMGPGETHWVFRWAVTLALMVSGLATAVFGPLLWGAVGLSGGVNWIVDLGAGLLAALSRRLAAGVTLLDVVGRAGETAAEVVATPQVLGLMLATVLFGLATLRLLTGMVAAERSPYHA